jgi:hypothetical protein
MSIDLIVLLELKITMFRTIKTEHYNVQDYFLKYLRGYFVYCLMYHPFLLAVLNLTL